MKSKIKICLFILSLFFISCDKEEEITQSLKSTDIDKIICGARMAGETGDAKYVPILLQDDGNPSIGTDIHFKGFSIYNEKMYALKKILKIAPPHKIIQLSVDSANIKFYDDYWRKLNKSK